MIKNKGIMIVALVGVLLGGCTANKPLYHWGSYENLVRTMYVEPGEAPSALQIEKLTADIELSEASGQAVPPGLYAHLAMMYAAEGKPGLAREALEKEKQLFPESSRLIDTLLANQVAGGAQ